jgi:hypothetical protein
MSIRIEDEVTKLWIVDDPLNPLEAQELLDDSNAMRAVIDGSGTLPPAATWLKFYDPECVFRGAIALLNILENPLQVEFHLFYLSTAPRLEARRFGELAHIYALQLRLQPYTVIQAKPELQYMINFMRRMGTIEIPHHGRYFYMPPADWTPKYVKTFKVYHDW